MDIKIETVIAPIIAAVASIIGTIFTYYSIRVAKNNAKMTQESENKRNEAQIDANITWNARVEWIQNVRKTTVEFVAACYKFIDTNDMDTINQTKNRDSIKEKASLLILYFGPDNIEQKGKKAQDINDISTNNAKNEMIVELINNISDQSSIDYFVNKIMSKSCKTKLAQCSDCENSPKKEYRCESWDHETNESYVNTEDDCIKTKEDSRNKINEYDNQKAKFISDIDSLIYAMRTYLKIEWNKTKTRNK